MSSLLVTGGAGFIGGNFVRYWRKKYPSDRIVVLDALTYAGNAATLSDIPDVELVVRDICDDQFVEQILRNRQIDTVVHFAAESHVDRSISGPDAFINTNILGTHSLLKAARKVWLQGDGLDTHRFHHVSTDEVYGSLGPTDPAFSETTAYSPRSPYSASKAASDHLVMAYHHTYGLKATLSNCSNNYGPYQFPEKLIPLFILNALHGKPLPVYGTGQNIRDWLHVEDHCRGIEAALLLGKNGEQYNIGGGVEMTNVDLIQALCTTIDTAFAANPSLAEQYPDAPHVSGCKCQDSIVFVADRPGHDMRYAIDETKARAELGYMPSKSFEEGLAGTVQWYLDNQSWWAPILDGSYLEQRGAA